MNFQILHRHKMTENQNLSLSDDEKLHCRKKRDKLKVLKLVIYPYFYDSVEKWEILKDKRCILNDDWFKRTSSRISRFEVYPKENLYNALYILYRANQRKMKQIHKSDISNLYLWRLSYCPYYFRTWEYKYFKLRKHK